MAASAPISACPACDAAPLARETASRAIGDKLILSLPTIHCAACISAVERGLAGLPGLKDARVNLTLKRVTLTTAPGFPATDAITRLADIGYEAHELDPGQLTQTAAARTGRDLLMRLGVAGFAMMNVMLLSVAVWSGAEAATRDMFHWISAAIALPTIAFSAQPFFRNAWRALSVRRLNMDVPISLAILLAGAMSLWEVAHSGHHAYFDAALSLTFFLLAGRYLDHRSRAVARSAAQELAALDVPRALRVRHGKAEEVAVDTLTPGDIVRVRPGGRVPVDGIIRKGQSEIDRALLTGESLPVFAAPGQIVAAGEVNLTGPLEVEVTAAGNDSSLHRMAELVAIAETRRNRYTSLADRAARIYAPGVHLLALFAFLGWITATGDLRLALNIAVAVLIITCPCALGLAVPAVTTAATGRLFKRGLLVKNATALERLAEVDTVVFDKTGTLTMGLPRLREDPVHDTGFAVALGLAQGSAHPLAKALLQAAEGTTPAQIEQLAEVPGHGVQGQWQGQTVRLGRAEWVGATAGNDTAVWLQIGDQPPRAFTFTDSLRPGAAELVAALREQGKSVHLLSGDAPGPVGALARELGISEWRAAILPAEKAAFVEALAAQNNRVLMVGDGLNDTAALAAAHVSVAPASALDAARVASDIVLLGRDLAPLSGALVTARKATARIRENFAIAAAYNAVAIPIALAGFATPLMAALAMSLSSICVSMNALRLR
ncbi:ATPase [Actibacterium mucosum KCTC 23349]|uniref:ATPase n=1 Tax=Actibacterium mucosum KCTC 23349 TaxID=1454373 RepID=A0A037ZFI5_9RHOB|nr:heavy metal translocating P-type ATPase [Actibacterium mucosum]KAJ54878.1 ATPase [Actibacterium mucosum KCTC 23349]